MLDVRLIREDIQKVTEGVKKRGQDIGLTGLLKLDEEMRRLLKESEGFKYKRNTVSDKIGELKKKGVNTDKDTLEMREVSQKLKELDARTKELSEDINNRLLNIPNMPHSSVPVGRSAGDNVEIKKWGNPRKFNFPVKSHIELGDVVGLDFQRASKIAGAGFVLYKGMGARLERALINFMLDLHVKEHGYLEVSPPFMVNRASMI